MFQLAFSLALIWVFVFLILCKGLKSFGKAVFLLTILPLIALAAVICKLLYVVDPAKLQVSTKRSSDAQPFMCSLMSSLSYSLPHTHTEHLHRHGLQRIL